MWRSLPVVFSGLFFGYIRRSDVCGCIMWYEDCKLLWVLNLTDEVLNVTASVIPSKLLTLLNQTNQLEV